ncbi:hypothetical protein MML48_2g00013129 [Holotrichia oblita]|uniref:Uncharacterized protein n=1 Tax=Holotrichia oblita TaxID=644536 RepID=A0ACB9TMP3_HOLOL|nr:hypothetical protein MML48_2g00013129 [Holotrichia oblita]
MTPDVFEELVKLVKEDLQKTDCKLTVHYIIKETTAVLWDKLCPIVLPEPTKEQFENIAIDFYERWNMPNCIGAVDGKHVSIQAPKHSGSERKRKKEKKEFSIVLLVTCDAKYCFSMVDIGSAGAKHNSTVFKESTYGKALLNDTLDIPPPKELPHCRIMCNHFVVASISFAQVYHATLSKTKFVCTAISLIIRYYNTPTATPLRFIMDMITQIAIASACDDDDLLDTTSSSDDEMEDIQIIRYSLNSRQCIENYFDVISKYNDVEFRTHFRFGRDGMTFLSDRFSSSSIYQDLLRTRYLRLNVTAYKSMLIFVWFASHKDGYRQIGDRFDLSISSVFEVITRVSLFLSGLAENVIRFPISQEKTDGRIFFSEVWISRHH